MKTALVRQNELELSKFREEITKLEKDITQSDDSARKVFTGCTSLRLEQGQLLLKAKAICPKGDWELWCSTLPISKSTIERRIKDALDPSRLTGPRTQAEVLALEDKASNGEARPQKELVPYLVGLDRGEKFCGYIKSHPLAEWPEEGKAKLREDLRPIVIELGGTL